MSYWLAAPLAGLIVVGVVVGMVALVVPVAWLTQKIEESGYDWVIGALAGVALIVAVVGILAWSWHSVFYWLMERA